jgi:hypothetical protein
MKWKRLSAGAILAAAVTILAVGPGPASGRDVRAGANSVTFPDSTGEDAAGPDITTVTVSNTDGGTIRFQINVPNRPTLAADMLVDILVDADNNAATGAAPIGIDYAIQLDGLTGPAEVNLFKWDGTNFTRRPGDPPATTLVFSYANGATIEIGARELGNTKRFKFGASVVSGIVVNPDTGDVDFANAHDDAAPDAGHGLWDYEVKTAPLRLVARSFAATPARPKAGKPYTVRLVAARSDTGAVLAGGEVRCVAKVAGKTVAPRTRGIVNRAAQCSWLIPKTATGKTISGSVTIVFEGLTVSRRFTAKIS